MKKVIAPAHGATATAAASEAATSKAAPALPHKTAATVAAETVAAAVAAAHEASRPVKVLFVCLGNICRSPAAEGIMRHVVELQGREACWEIDSAGTGDYHIGDLPDSRMRAAAARRGLQLTHRCRQVRTEDFYDFDLIIGMDGSNLRNLRSMSPSPETDRKILAMADFLPANCGYDYIPDPYYEGREGFELVLDLLETGCANLAAMMRR